MKTFQKTEARAAIVVLVVLVGLLSVAAGRADAGLPVAPVKMLSPAPSSLVEGKRLLVRMRVEPGVSRLRLRVAGRPMVLSDSKSGGGVRTASVSVKGLPRGRVTLSLAARRHGREISLYRLLILGRQTPGLLRHVYLPRRAAGAVKMKVLLGGEVSSFRFRVNGRRARTLQNPDVPAIKGRAGTILRHGHPIDPAGPLAASATTFPLSADDGLHEGRNRVAVLAYRAKSGDWAREVRTVWISRRVPMVAAGPDRRLPSGRTLRLDGRASRPTHRGQRLRYEWRILSQPKAPRHSPPAHLLETHAVRPRLEVHRPGTYKVGLRVSPDSSDPSATAGDGLRVLPRRPSNLKTS